MVVDTLKKILPIWLKIVLRNIVKYFKYKYRRIVIFFPILKGEQIKIIIGAAIKVHKALGPGLFESVYDVY